MLDLLEKELAINGISFRPKGIVEIEGIGSFPVSKAVRLYKTRAKSICAIVSKLWNEVSVILSKPSLKSHPPDGVENVFICALQGLKKMLILYPGLPGIEKIDDILSKALNSDIDDFSFKIMSKVIEYKLAIEWVGHILAKNLYLRSLIIRAYSMRINRTESVAKGVHGPFSNLDLPMKERVYEWSEIDEEVAGRDRDIKGQHRYKMGLEGYNDPHVNEGFIWREIKNEPFLWGKEGENPYPHRNKLWS